MSKPSKKSEKSVRVVNSIEPDSRLTKSSSPFSSVPFTTSPGLPIQPLTTPKLRQLVESENVKIYGPGI